MLHASDAAFARAAERIGCDLPTIRAVFRVEAAGVFLDPQGEPVRRFEPHHFPKEHWPALGFAPQGTAPWRASLALSKRQRRDMFERASAISYEDACNASSWGAPQIMGHNHSYCGYPSATRMVEAFRDPDAQVDAFGKFVVNRGLALTLIQREWRRFASGYNGSGQADVYAELIRAAYARETGERPTLRRGSTGELVRVLQRRLGIPADGTFGPVTETAVREWQHQRGLVIDGIVGAATWNSLAPARALEGAVDAPVAGPVSDTAKPGNPAPAPSSRDLRDWRIVGAIVTASLIVMGLIAYAA